jgi:signal transduction histidine kinase
MEPFFALRHLRVNHSPGAAGITFAICAVALLLPFAIRLGLSARVAVEIMCVAVIVAGSGVCLARGRFFITPLMGLVFLPLSGVMLARRRSTVVWWAAGFVTIGSVALLSKLGALGMSAVGSGDAPQLLFFVTTSAILGIAYDHTRREVERERAALQERLAKTQRVESLGFLAAGIAHDFNNLLTVFRSTAAALKDELPKDHPARADAEIIDEAVERGITITARLLTFARREKLQVEVFDASAVVSSLRKILERTLPVDRIELEIDAGATPLHASGDPRELEQALLNIVVNARDAMPKGGKLKVSLRADQKNVIIAVRDTGTGIPADVLPHLFEPFFTTKLRGAGTGLGLSTAYGALKAMGGDILVETEIGVGTCFEIRLRATESPNATMRSAA